MIESKYFDKSVSVDQATLITISNKYNTVMIGDFRQVYRSDYEIYTWGHCYIEKDSMLNKFITDNEIDLALVDEFYEDIVFIIKYDTIA